MYTYTPKLLERGEEAELQKLKTSLISVTKDYCSKNKIKGKNCNINVNRGITSLRARRERNECVIFQTDKTGTFSIDTPDNYIDAMRPHIDTDTAYGDEVIKDLEKTMNAHAIFWTNILQIATDTGDQGRVKSTMTSHNSECGKEYGFRKDHKPGFDEEGLGHPMRPMCDVSDAYNHRLSYLICKVITHLIIFR